MATLSNFPIPFHHGKQSCNLRIYVQVCWWEEPSEGKEVTGTVFGHPSLPGFRQLVCACEWWGQSVYPSHNPGPNHSIWLLSTVDMCTGPSVPGRGFPGEWHAVRESGETRDHFVTPESIRPADAVYMLYLSCDRTQESQSSSLQNAGKWYFRCTVGSLCQWVLHPTNDGAKILNKLYLYWTWVEFLLHFYGIRYHKLCRNDLNYSEITVQIIWK